MSVSVGVGYGGGVGVGVSGGIGVSGSIGVSGGVGCGGVGVSAGVGCGGVGVSVSTPTVHVSSPSVGISVSASVDIEPPNSNEILSESLRSHSVCAVCMMCKQPGHTVTTPRFNILNCLFAYFCTEFWCCYMCYKRKDWNCYSTRHECQHCNKYIDTYSAC